MSALETAPGPWRACHNGQCSCGFVWSIADDVHVASVHGPSALGADWYGGDKAPNDAMQVANAHLIAAAPALYEALEGLVPVASGHPMSGIEAESRLQAALSALALARGETLTTNTQDQK
jgi:hypothetical protein